MAGANALQNGALAADDSGHEGPRIRAHVVESVKTGLQKPVQFPQPGQPRWGPGQLQRGVDDAFGHDGL